MGYFFEHFPVVKYDIEKNGNTKLVMNPLVRFKIRSILENKTVLYYTYDIKDGERGAEIAERYYGDSTLDWVLFLVNDIIDPQYDWPLGYQDLLNYIKSKYGSVSDAQSEVHHYEWIYQQHAVLSDGTIVPAKHLEVDATTYVTLAAADRREVDAYTYEVEKNDAKRLIKVLNKSYIPAFVSEVRAIFK